MHDPSQTIPDEWSGPPRRHQTWKVIATVVTLVVAMDLVIGAMQSRLSMDLVHQVEIPGIIKSFSGGSGDRPKTLFLGNSLVREGIDAKTFGGLVFKIHPDDTSIVEWRYLFDRVARADLSDRHTIVLGYAQNQLTDDSIVRARRLGSQYLNADTLPTIWSTDVTDFGGRCELMLSRFSASIANAERIRTRLLVAFVPQYEVTAQRLNRAVVTASMSDEKSKLKLKPEPEPGPTYDRLQHVIDAASQHVVDLSIVAIPVGETYELEPGLLERLSNAGIRHIDGRSVAGIDDESFPDGYHMDADAAKRFTAFVHEKMEISGPATSPHDKRPSTRRP